MNLNDTVVMMVAENSVVPFPSSLFLDVHYTIDTTTPFISLEEQSWLQSTLFNQGATYSPLPGQSPLLLLNPTLWSTQFPNITHVLTLNTLPEFRVLDLNEASTSLPPSSSSSSNTDTITSTSPSSSSAKPSPIAVTPQWVYDCIKTKKRINEFYYSSYDKDVFSGWVIALVDIDDPIEFCELCATIEAFGGQWRNGGDLENPDPLTTHVVGKKNHISERTAQLLQTRFSHLPHVDVAWLVDSSIRQTRFSFHSYPLFPQVRAIEELHRPPFYFHLDAFNTFHTCLKHKRIYFHSDVPSHLLEPFKKIISLSEGKVLDSSVEAETVLRLADVLIFKHAHSSLFISAVQQKKWVATPYWFLDVLYYGQWISPWSLLLYFPFPFKKRSLQDACVGLTQFRGRHRQIVKELCTLLGFTCTSVLSTKTQFLIVGKAEGPKYLTAQQHGLPIVTLDWLEQSLAQGHRPPLTTLPPLWRPTLHVCQPVLEITVAWVLKEVLHQVHQHHQRTQKLLSQLGSQKSSLSPIKKQRVAKELASTKWNLQYASLATMDSKEREWVLKTWEDENDVDETVDVMDVQDPDDQETLISSSDVPIQPSTQSTVVILCYAKHKPSARDLKAFQSLGIQVAKLNEPFTHYVISHLELDACFLYAMYSAKYMVTPKWVDACIRERKLLDPYPYRLRDPVLENKYNFVLTTALEKAKFCQLLTGWTITSATLSDEVFPAYLARVVWKAGGKIIPLSKIDSKFPPPLLLFLHFSSPKPENISMLSSTFPDLYQCDLETFKRVLLCQSLQPLFETVN